MEPTVAPLQSMSHPATTANVTAVELTPLMSREAMTPECDRKSATHPGSCRLRISSAYQRALAFGVRAWVS